MTDFVICFNFSVNMDIVCLLYLNKKCQIYLIFSVKHPCDRHKIIFHQIIINISHYRIQRVVQIIQLEVNRSQHVLYSTFSSPHTQKLHLTGITFNIHTIPCVSYNFHSDLDYEYHLSLALLLLSVLKKHNSVWPKGETRLEYVDCLPLAIL